LKIMATPRGPNLADLRREYTQAGLLEHEVEADPIRQFHRWFEQARTANPGDWFEPNAMTLATVGADGEPSARVVLLKECDFRGFVFFTNYASRKGRELAAHPRAALVFYWGWLERQVRVNGAVTRLPPEQSQAYFRTRPRSSQFGALASDQSGVVPNRDVLEARLRELEARYQGRDVPMPETWGGYRLRPDAIEFWQGRPNRLHDRLLYRRVDDSRWVLERLAP
jgi:pyridoxamine 5'-phosphate oxidase